MTDRDEHKAYGVITQWMAIYENNDVVTEFDKDHTSQPLSSVDWARVKYFKAVPIDLNIYEQATTPSGLHEFTVLASVELNGRPPVWRHDSVGTLGGGGYTPIRNTDVIGYEENSLRYVWKIPGDGSPPYETVEPIE